MKNWQITLLGLSLILSSCSSQVTTESDETLITDDPAEDYIVDESLSPEEAEAQAEEIAIVNRETYKSAVSNGDSESCSEIESYDLKFSCEQNAIIQKAVLESDSSICEQMSTEKGKEKCSREVEQESETN